MRTRSYIAPTVGAVALTLLGVAACSAPEDDVETSNAAQTEAPARPDRDDVDHDKIDNDDPNPLLRDDETYGIGVPPLSDHSWHSAKTMTPEQAALGTTPQAFIASISDPAKKPRRFAAATVLAAYKRLRRYYHTYPYETRKGNGIWAYAPFGRGITIEDHAKLKKDGSWGIDLTTPFDDFELTWNSSGDGHDGGNLGVMPPNWSDIQAHFYVLPPHRRHGCWTVALQTYASAPDVFVKGKPETDFRGTINSICNGEKTMREDLFTDPGTPGGAQWKLALSVVPVELSAYNLLWVDVKAKKFIALPDEIRNSLDVATLESPKDIEKSRAVQFANEQRRAGHVNVWDYIMLSSTYAFDWEQQQAVLNAFYGANKSYTRRDGSSDSEPEFHPENPADCKFWRPARPTEANDGTQCRADKRVSVPMLSNGR